MKITHCRQIIFSLIFMCIAQHTNAEQENRDIRLRIHSPFSDLYEGEQDSWLIRIENHSEVAIPVPVGFPHPDDDSYFPPPQFHVQTWEQANQGIEPQVSAWAEFQKFGTGELVSDDGEITMDSSLLLPGKAMESPSVYRSSRLRTPLEDGKFRMALQVGPDKFVYSNWLTRERTGIPPLGIRTIMRAEPWATGIKTEIQISENTKPRYLWFTTIGTANIILNRICAVPEGSDPSVILDNERGQFIISFASSGYPSLYFGHRIGITKNTPFPEGYRSKDFSLTPYPISSPSPIGFPTELFNENIETMDMEFNFDKTSSFIPRSDGVVDNFRDKKETKIKVRHLLLPAGLLLILNLIHRRMKRASAGGAVA